ncbi:histidine phosphatase family protein [Brachybacterium sp. YJGR34]|uniref:histidine phosphatase family protein n=1 Tax=Brachybacterium sp. YJGR34 TaxID=2059911 RepID=UPI000E0B90A1|nr:histidine phosphatase family protein [Brachybacterium sp. YJGR34]
MPVPDPSAAPTDWPLSESGRAAAIALRDRVPEEIQVLSSPEVKAVETAVLVTGRVPRLDARFGEVTRPGEPFDEAVRDRRRAWVGDRHDERHRGWETPHEAGRRFGDALSEHPGEDLLVATHGMVMTSWLASIGLLLRGEEAAAFWEALTFPDLVGVEVSATGARIIGHGVPGRPLSR